MKRRITFSRDNLTLVGDLFTPDGFDETRRYPALVVQGSLTSVKEQMPGTYAARLAEHGFVALAFDYAHYGESDGQPRQLESPNEKLRDLQAAVTYLTDLDYVEAVGAVGVCTSASNVVSLGAIDSRVKALATVAGFLPSPGLLDSLMGAEEVRRRKAQAEDARRTYEQTGEVEMVTTYSETDRTALNYNPTDGAYDYYLNPARGNVSQYRNQSAVMGIGEFYELDPLADAPSITLPTIVVHSGGAAFPEQAKAFYDTLPSKKELVWGSGDHYDYYDDPEQVDDAVAHVTRFFHDHLDS